MVGVIATDLSEIVPGEVLIRRCGFPVPLRG